jgi:hypothetical protein
MKRASESPDFFLGWIYCSVNQGPKMTFQCEVLCKCLNEEYTGLGDRARLFAGKKFLNQSSAFGKLSEEVYLASQEFKESRFVIHVDGRCLKLVYPDRDWRYDPPRRLRCFTCGKEKTLDAHWFWDHPNHLTFLCDCDGKLREISNENEMS